MSMKELMAAGNSLASGDTPEGVSFDGSNDWLSRSSVLSGSSDTVKTLTLSVWVYYDPIPAVDSQIVKVLDIRQGSSGHVALQLRVGSYGTAAIAAEYGSSWGQAINDVYNDSSTPDAGVPQSGWNHILYSVDLNNTTSAMYINDVLANPSTDGSSLANQPMLFTTYGADINVGRQYGGNYYMKGRLAHLFLDFTYRNLSTVSNRRLFIDSDGKPSDTIPSSPILYLPMTEASTAGSNSGTGGDFTVNGVLDTAGRGPNQNNCSASEFDGSNDYLSVTSGLGATNSRTITCAFTFRRENNSSGEQDIIMFDDWGVGGGGSQCYVKITGDNKLSVSMELSGSGYAAQIKTNAVFTYGKHYAVALSFDTGSSGGVKSKVYIDGVSQTLATNVMYYSRLCEIDTDYVYIGRYRRTADYFLKGSFGEFYFDTTYTDLATDNPFWDSDTNRPKPVRQVISETGTTPLIAMPMRANDAGNNLGSGGDFTVNPTWPGKIGARGGSEFWARSVINSANTSYLANLSPVVSGTSTKYTLVKYFYVGSSASGNQFLSFHEYTGGGSIVFYFSNTNEITLTVSGDNNGNSATAFNIITLTSSISTNSWNKILISFDLTDTSKKHAYLNDIDVTGRINFFNNYPIPIGDIDFFCLGEKAGSRNFLEKYALAYEAASYIDFSQESNRNLFVDQLGYPKDLTPAIDAGDIAEPLIYMKFDDTSALGTNSGTGGNFTVNGTVTAGADVDPNA